MPQYNQTPHYFANTPLQPDDLLFPSSTYSNQTSPSTAFSPYLATYDVPGTHAYVNSNATANTAIHPQYYSPNPWALSPSALPVPSGAALFDKLPSPDCPPLISLPPALDVDAELDLDLNLELELELERELHAQDREAVFRQQQEQCRQQVAAMHRMHNMQTLDTASSSSSSSSEYAYAIRAPRTPPMCTLNSEPAAVSVPSPEDDTDGEILVGMGLYDPPEKSGQDVDPTLQSYRSSVAQLLGAAYTEPPPAGKGLKLEDAWEPPENMDDDEDEDDERDAEGEEQ